MKDLNKYTPYVIGFLLALSIFILFSSNRDLKFRHGQINSQLNEITSQLDNSKHKTRELASKNIELLDSVSIIGGLLNNSYVDRQRESEHYEYRLRQIPKLTAIQIDSAIQARYPDIETRDIEILTDAIEGDKCKIELRFADNQIELLKRRNFKQGEVIKNQAKIIRNKDTDNELLQSQINKMNELIAIQDSQIKRAKWKTRGVVVVGIALLVLTNI